MTLDDKEDNEEPEDISQEMDNMSISGQSSSDDEKGPEADDLNVDEINLSEDEENDNQIDENRDKKEELNNENKSDDKIEDKEENKSEEKSSIKTDKDSDNLSNNQLNGSDESDKNLENEINAKNSSDVCVEQNAENSGEPNETVEEQHGFNETLVGDNSTSDGQQMITSVTFNDSDVKEEKLRKNNKRENSRRSLAENYDKNVKRQKVVPNESDDNVSDPQINDNNNSENQRLNSKLYRHIDHLLEANNQVIDIATNEEKLKQNEELENESKNDIDFDKTEDMEIEETNESIEEIKPNDYNSVKSKANSGDNKNNEIEVKNEESMQIEGQNVETLTVQRGNESTFHTSLDLVDSKECEEMTLTFDKQSDERAFERIKELDMNSVIEVWKECESKMCPLVYELCERLQLVLEPTKTAKLKGDYRTGKRLNMRKVIAYIASDFRKDKIWLRRTKPSKRQYQIVIAIDDSSSMADNKSKQLAFESLALLGKSLSLLEAGELAVMSFGQTVNLLHSFNEPFNDNTGVKLLTQVSLNSLNL